MKREKIVKAIVVQTGEIIGQEVDALYLETNTGACFYEYKLNNRYISGREFGDATSALLAGYLHAVIKRGPRPDAEVRS